MEPRIVIHPQLGRGKLLRTYMAGFEWYVEFESGRSFRLPAKEFEASAESNGETVTPAFAPRAPMLETDQFRARQTLEALRLGVVPVQDAETLTIGLEAEQVTLNRALDRSREHGGDVIAVIGDYGFGKSHFVELAARRALRQNFLVGSASLDLLEVPPSKAHKIYEALVTSLRYPDTHERGLRPLFQKALDNPAVVNQFVALSPRGSAECPLAAALVALQDCHSQLAFDEIVEWLSGQVKPTTEMKTCLKKPPRLYIQGETGRQYSYLLTGLSVLAAMLGYSGLAVLIDESEHYSLLKAAQREKADSFFQALIVGALGLNNGRIDARNIPSHRLAEYDIAFASQPHLFFLFALTESEGRMPVGSWLSPPQIVRLDDRFIEKDILEFFKTLLSYHALAYDYSPGQERYEPVVRSVPGMLSRTLAQHRVNLRELIRTGVTVCDLFYWHADYTPDELMSDLKRGLKI